MFQVLKKADTDLRSMDGLKNNQGIRGATATQEGFGMDPYEKRNFGDEDERVLLMSTNHNGKHIDINWQRSVNPFARPFDSFAREHDPFGGKHDPFAKGYDPFAEEHDPFTKEHDPFAEEHDRSIQHDSFAGKYQSAHDPFAGRHNNPFNGNPSGNTSQMNSQGYRPNQVLQRMNWKSPTGLRGKGSRVALTRPGPFTFNKKFGHGFRNRNQSHARIQTQGSSDRHVIQSVDRRYTGLQAADSRGPGMQGEGQGPGKHATESRGPVIQAEGRGPGIQTADRRGPTIEVADRGGPGKQAVDKKGIQTEGRGTGIQAANRRGPGIQAGYRGPGIQAANRRGPTIEVAGKGGPGKQAADMNGIQAEGRGTGIQAANRRGPGIQAKDRGPGIQAADRRGPGIQAEHRGPGIQAVDRTGTGLQATGRGTVEMTTQAENRRRDEIEAQGRKESFRKPDKRPIGQGSIDVVRQKDKPDKRPVGQGSIDPVLQNDRKLLAKRRRQEIHGHISQHYDNERQQDILQQTQSSETNREMERRIQEGNQRIHGMHKPEQRRLEYGNPDMREDTRRRQRLHKTNQAEFEESARRDHPKLFGEAERRARLERMAPEFGKTARREPELFGEAERRARLERMTPEFREMARRDPELFGEAERRTWSESMAPEFREAEGRLIARSNPEISSLDREAEGRHVESAEYQRDRYTREEQRWMREVHASEKWDLNMGEAERMSHKMDRRKEKVIDSEMGFQGLCNRSRSPQRDRDQHNQSHSPQRNQRQLGQVHEQFLRWSQEMCLTKEKPGNVTDGRWRRYQNVMPKFASNPMTYKEWEDNEQDRQAERRHRR